MISDIVLSLALFGGFNDQLSELESGAVSAALRDNVMSTQDEVLEFVERNPAVITKIFDLLDVNEDGIIDAQELAAMEMKGATTASLDMTPDEAFTLADGSVREDGDVGTCHISEHNFKEWIVRSIWANLLRVVDGNGDGTLDNSEWESLVQASENMVADFVPSTTATSAAGGGLVAPANYIFPDSNLEGTEALVAAGVLLGQMDVRNADVATRRIFGVLAGAAMAAVVGIAIVTAVAFVGVGIVMGIQALMEALKHASYRGCWVDDSERDLDDYRGRGYNPNSCMDECWGFQYFAVQDKDQCFCGKDYGTQSKYYKVADSECKVYGEKLGGPWRNSVFERKL